MTGILQAIKNFLALLLKAGEALEKHREDSEREKQMDHAYRSGRMSERIKRLLSRQRSKGRTGAGDGGGKDA